MGVVTNDACQILLVRTQRRDWEPPGGQVELGEDLLVGLRREIREESCCEVEVVRLVGVYSNVGKPEQVIFNFLCKHTQGEPCAGHECLEAGWYEPQEALQRVTHPAQLGRLRDALTEEGVVYRAYRTRPEYEILTEARL